MLALARGEWEASEAYTRRALRIHEKNDPKGRFVVACLNNLGEVYRARGQLADAEAAYRRSLALAEPLNPEKLTDPARNSLGRAKALHALADAFGIAAERLRPQASGATG